MSAKKIRTNDQAPLEQPQIPPSIGKGHPEYHFTTIAMDLAASHARVETLLGVLTQKTDDITKSLESVKTKVEDINKLKTIVIAWGTAICFVLGVLGWLYKELKDDYEIVAKRKPVEQVVAIQNQQTIPAEVESVPQEKPRKKAK